MNNLTSEELKNLKNQFEIEERVLSLLKSEEHVKYFTEKLRRTTSGQFTTEDRLTINKARNKHWNNLAYSFALKYFGENNIKDINNNDMTEQGDSSSTVGNSDILKIAEILKEVILAKKKDNDFDFLEKPKKYDGSRDPHVIDSWIHSIEDFGTLKGYDYEQQCKLAVTLLSGSAQIWYQNLRLLDLAPRDWLSFKRELINFFIKPENTVSIARDKLRALKQTSSISLYVQQFMTIKLSIPKMTDDEAVDKFLAGLRDPNARIHVKDVIDMNDPVLTEAIRAAHTYEGNRTEVDYFGGSSGGSQIDDPMDLSVVERRELYQMMKSWNNAGGRGAFNTFRGGRGGIRGNYNGHRGARGGQQQRGGRPRGGDRSNLQCHNCKGYGHFMRVCPSP